MRNAVVLFTFVVFVSNYDAKWKFQVAIDIDGRVELLDRLWSQGSQLSLVLVLCSENLSEAFLRLQLCSLGLEFAHTNLLYYFKRL